MSIDTLRSLSCSNGQVAKWNGSVWVCSDVGTSPHTHAGSDITSGTISASWIDQLIARDTEVTTAVNAHALRTDNPHSTTAVQVGAVALNQPDSITSSMIVNGTISFADIGPNGCGANQIMKWNGTWGCGNDMTGDLTLPYSGTTSTMGTAFYVTQDGTGWGIAAESNGTIGIRGKSNATGGAGVAGYNYATGGVGVYGQGLSKAIHGYSQQASAYGVYGESNGAGGVGVYGSGPAWAGYFNGNVHASGNVGIGTLIPEGKLHISSPSSYYGMVKLVNSNPGDNEATMAFVEGSDATGGDFWLIGVGPWGNTNDFVIGRTAPRVVITPEGNVGLGTSSPPKRLTVRGNIAVESAGTGLTVIELGEGLDYAEGFYVTDRKNIGPGSVLIIDPDNPGKLRLSHKPYDTKVAGIVAGGKGLGSAVRLGVGQFDHDVALAGRVYCNVDGSYGEILPGDLLTTSLTPGYAMKVSDHPKSQGAILGKAMEKLGKGEKGQILVLVTLQ